MRKQKSFGAIDIYIFFSSKKMVTLSNIQKFSNIGLFVLQNYDNLQVSFAAFIWASNFSCLFSFSCNSFSCFNSSHKKKK